MKQKWINKLYLEIGIAILITVLPYSLFIHVFFKDNAETLHFLGVTINHGFKSTGLFLWFILKKLIPLTLFLIWFLTSRFWWRYVILVPMLPYLIGMVLTFTDSPHDTPIYIYDYWMPCVILSTFFISIIIIRKYFRIPEYSIETEHYSEYLVTINSSKKDYWRVKDYLTSLKKDKLRIADTSYLKRLFLLHRTVRKKLANIPNIRKGSIGKVFPISKIETSICLILLMMPPLYYFHKMIPLRVQRFDLFFFTVNSFGFNDIYTAVWYLTCILCFAIPFCIWFITERSWWRYAILSPIILSFYQIWEAFYRVSSVVDELGYLKSLPFLLVIIAILFAFSYYVRFKYKILDIYDRLTIEIKELISFFEKENVLVNDVKNEFAEIRQGGMDNRNKEKVARLLHLQKDLILELEKINHVEK